MATSTTQSIWRSGGGDTTKTAYAGSMLMVADFYFSGAAVASTAVQKSSTDTAAVVLPMGAIVTSIQTNAAITGGTTPTFDMGFNLYTAGTASPATLINEGLGTTAKASVNWETATAGTSLGFVMSATDMVKVTGSVGASAGTGGTVAGRIFYYVPTNGAYTA